jgi:hypothetical protein
MRQSSWNVSEVIGNTLVNFLDVSKCTGNSSKNLFLAGRQILTIRWRDDPSQGRLVPEHVPVDNTSLWAQHPCIIGSHVQNVPWMLCPKIICPYFMISASQIFFLQWSQRPSFFRDCMTAENILSVGNRDVWWKKQRLTLSRRRVENRHSFSPIFYSVWIFSDRREISADYRTAHPVHCTEKKLENFQNILSFESLNVTN